MTPKEKAKELFEKYYDMKWQSYSHKKTSIKSMTKLSCKQCALIAVDLAIEYNDFHIEFLQEVKQEIQNL